MPIRSDPWPAGTPLPRSGRNSSRTSQPMPGAPGDYLTFHLGEAPLGGMGGMMDLTAGLSSHWVAYCSVADTDAAVAAAIGGGGSLQGPPMGHSVRADGVPD